MPINNNYTILFIHIPKCAGTSIEKFFDMQKLELLYLAKDIYKINNIAFSPQHLRGKDLKEKYAKDIFDDYFKFSFVRNPYDRLVSEYFYQTKITTINKPHFKNWFFNYFKKIDTDHKLTQTEFLYIDGVLITDFIGKVENFNDDFNKLLNILDIKSNKSITHDRVKSNRQNIKTFDLLDKDDIIKINKIWYDDFINFDYKML